MSEHIRIQARRVNKILGQLQSHCLGKRNRIACKSNTITLYTFKRNSIHISLCKPQVTSFDTDNNLYTLGQPSFYLITGGVWTAVTSSGPPVITVSNQLTPYEYSSSRTCGELNIYEAEMKCEGFFFFFFYHSWIQYHSRWADSPSRQNVST